jgi:hypothetical protein
MGATANFAFNMLILFYFPHLCPSNRKGDVQSSATRAKAFSFLFNGLTLVLTICAYFPSLVRRRAYCIGAPTAVMLYRADAFAADRDVVRKDGCFF